MQIICQSVNPAVNFCVYQYNICCKRCVWLLFLDENFTKTWLDVKAGWVQIRYSYSGYLYLHQSISRGSSVAVSKDFFLKKMHLYPF